RTAVHPNRRSTWWRAGTLGAVPSGGPAPRQATRNPRPRPSKARQRRTSTPNDVRRSRPYPPPPAAIWTRVSAAIQAKCCGEMTASSPPRDKRRVCQRLLERSRRRSQQRRVASRGGLHVGRRDAAVVRADRAALLFVAVDIRTTPESAVLKWGFVL